MNEFTEYSRQKKRKVEKKKKKKKLIWNILFPFLFIILSLGGLAIWKIDYIWGQIYKQVGQQSPSSNHLLNNVLPSEDNKIVNENQPFTMLIMGLDTRKKTGSLNTDVMLLAQFNSEQKKIYLTSIPRDTKVKIPGYKGYRKVNSAFALGEMERRSAENQGKSSDENGVSLAKETVGQLFDIPIDYYMTIDFQGFIKVIDYLGGIKINVDRSMRYDDPTDNTHINLDQGEQILDGQNALYYVRHRHDNRGIRYESSDFDRNRRQQEVLKAVFEELKSWNGITKIFGLMEIAGEHFKTDINQNSIKRIILEYQRDLQMESLDNKAYWNGSFTIIPPDRLKEIQNILKGLKPMEEKNGDTSKDIKDVSN